MAVRWLEDTSGIGMAIDREQPILFPSAFASSRTSRLKFGHCVCQSSNCMCFEDVLILVNSHCPWVSPHNLHRRLNRLSNTYTASPLSWLSSRSAASSLSTRRSASRGRERLIKHTMMDWVALGKDSWSYVYSKVARA